LISLGALMREFALQGTKSFPVELRIKASIGIDAILGNGRVPHVNLTHLLHQVRGQRLVNLRRRTGRECLDQIQIPLSPEAVDLREQEPEPPYVQVHQTVEREIELP